MRGHGWSGRSGSAEWRGAGRRGRRSHHVRRRPRGRCRRRGRDADSRVQSVRIGLEATSSPIVLVHDAARPLVTREAITDLTRTAASKGAAVLCAPAVDTIKIADKRGRVVSTPDRALLWHAQTPQGFRRSVLVNAYKVNGDRDATDDVQLVERAGGTVWIVGGPATNFKVTTAEDLDRAEKLIRVH